MNSFLQRRWLAGSGVCAAFLAVLCAAISCSAGVGAAHGDSAFSLTCWNIQTFFDGETSGTEYAEYRGAKSFWNREKYQSRLKRLCESVAAFDSDMLAFEEIENEETVADIANELYGHLARNKLYPYACFAREDGGSVGCAVLSRFPLQNCTVHQCDFRCSCERTRFRLTAYKLGEAAIMGEEMSLQTLFSAVLPDFSQGEQSL